MKKKVQQAIVAARAGELMQAQALLADVLEQDQGDIQAWYLLSNLVESDTQRTAYLQKVLTLDPAYAPAVQQLDEGDGLLVGEAVEAQTTELLEAEAEVVKTQTTEVLDEIPTDLTADLTNEEALLLSALMAEDDEDITFSADDFVAQEMEVVEEADTAVSNTQPIADVPTKEMEALPPTVELSAADAPTQFGTAIDNSPTVAAEAVAPAPTKTAVVKEPSAAKPKSKKSDPAPLTGVLYLLIGMTIITFLALLYFAFF